LHQIGIKSLLFEAGEESVLINQNRLTNKGIKQMFPEIEDPNQPSNGFKIQMRLKDIKNNQFRIKAIGNDNKEYLSQIIYMD
jgi:hypothetical protein